MPNDEREDQFERALARHLRNASPDSACPDAEILAAYHERTLSPQEMARAKEHIAGCTRCQESLALVEQSEGAHAASVQQLEAVPNVAPRQEAATPIRTMAPRPPWRWIVPVGALAAGVIVWVGVREIQTQRSQERESVQVAQNRQAAPQPPVDNYKAADQLKKEEPPAQNLDGETGAQKVPASSPPKVASPGQAGTVAKKTAPLPPASTSAPGNPENLRTSGAAKVAPPTPTSPFSSGVSKSRTVQMAAPPAAGGAAAAGAVANRSADEKKNAPVSSVTETVEVTAAPPPANATSPSALNSSSTQLTMEPRNGAALLQLAAGDPRYIVAPGEKHAWRVGEAGKIERSTDRGKTWKLEKSGVTADLTAGSATSDKICWVIGKAGTVLLTTDGGKRWKQISSPISEDLGGIHATDALHAAIWDVPNRKSFETTDGGAIWNRTSKE
jgi:hypothetical protein